MFKKTQNNFKEKALTGGAAVAEAMRQVNPEVMCAYPITPQTPIIETFAQIKADGLVDTELVLPESEHSALSIVVGASAAGTRAMTATASQGLALMAEILWAASGLRLPIVMAVAGRALSAPINVHGDHSDSIGLREAGWVQLYSETAQEAYENMLLAVRLAEASEVRLPVMVMLDGFFTSHNVENVKIFNDKIIKKFLGQYKAEFSLFNTQDPVSYGPLALPNYYFEIKYQQQQAMKKVVSNFKKIAGELKKITQTNYKIFEEYKVKDADYVMIVMGSTAGTAKEVVDDLRKQGHKVGILKPVLYRPFPYQAMAQVLKNKKAVAVLDRAMSFGAQASLYTDIKSSLYHEKKRPLLQSYVYGLGGRDIYDKDINQVFKDLMSGKINQQEKYINLRK
ncbi:MAG: pyruvate ferredoxin oxidoreductase [Patescibacteria group bacterium]|nr:pyruvate ferredoxin oxidoreductase [Patescibacteria group bacterium]